MPHQMFILQIISVFHLKHSIIINYMILALIEFICKNVFFGKLEMTESFFVCDKSRYIKSGLKMLVS